MSMEIVTDPAGMIVKEKTAVAIGKFDGIHIGHKKILSEIMKAGEKGFKKVIFTFEPSPEVFFGAPDCGTLMTRDEKREYLESCGIDMLIEYPMNEETSAVEPELFIRKCLKEQLNMGFIAAGSDLSYGKGGKGDFNLLDSLKTELGYETVMVDKVRHGGFVVSSTTIRNAVAGGDMHTVEEMLGRPYSFSGTVTTGKQLGRTIGFPTANLDPLPGRVIPPYGAYFSDVELSDGRVFRAVTNIGCKPTVKADKKVNIESYLLDFSGDIYGERITVMLREFRRPEQKFTDLYELKDVLQADIAGRRLWHFHN